LVIHHIRRAKHFIYIENQYFLGSAQFWEDNKDNKIACLNMIPIELTNKICSSIEQRKPFAVYILLPMYPEGIPESAATQEILCWQNKTMKMMYGMIHKCLQKEGLLGEKSPTDYLNFYCLGNRETLEGSQHDLQAPSPPKDLTVSRAVVLNQTRRFMIYVHSKMMIVDDEYIILGSANINQRSLSGGRDTEITVGCVQPHYTAQFVDDAKKVVQLPRGEVHCFRMALWAEHTARVLNCYQQPGDLECVHAVNKIAKRNWDAYCGDKIVDMTHGHLHSDPYSPNSEHLSHLMSYPITVTSDGKVTPLKDRPCFPDTSASVCGCDSTLLPNLLTL